MMKFMFGLDSGYKIWTIEKGVNVKCEMFWKKKFRMEGCA